MGISNLEIVLFAFADFRDGQRSDVVVLLRTLLAQLLEHCKPEDIVEDRDFAELEKTIERHHADRPKLIHHLVKLLEKASVRWKRVFIVIDALDECAKENRREFMVAIGKVASAGSKLSVFVSSQGGRDIMDVLSGLPTISLSKETQSVHHDMRKFAEYNLRVLLSRLPEPIRTRTLSTVLEKAHDKQVLPLLPSENFIDF